ncbi:MAG: 3-deoxy-D-manno-octulosonic acid transferase [Bacteroidetes bacterium]|nr:3-deoxy-D-manno-octulosonic acid transferase [Bacteroidota bacterium]
MKGRRNLETNLSSALHNDQKTAWFHCASLGEFEQGRPVLEAFRLQYPGFRVILSFFSPSGYEIRKSYPLADYICYMPLDTPEKVRSFLDILKPDIVFFIKYEYWFNFINELNSRKIPIFIISGIFRPDQHFFRWYGQWFRKMLGKINYFFLQDQESLTLLQSIGINNALVSGDTRFDRVAGIASNPAKFPMIASFRSRAKVLLAGSTWPADEDLLLPLILDPTVNLKYIIAPHEVHPERIEDLLQKLGDRAVRFSSISDQTEPWSYSVIVVDSIGQLSSLYQYADIAYIGGGFGKGIHNILEAATFGLPVFFGPNYQRFAEARELIRLGGAVSINLAAELMKEVTGLLKDEGKRKKASAICSDYVKNNTGATGRILEHLPKITTLKD